MEDKRKVLKRKPPEEVIFFKPGIEEWILDVGMSVITFILLYIFFYCLTRTF